MPRQDDLVLAAGRMYLLFSATSKPWGTDSIPWNRGGAFWLGCRRAQEVHPTSGERRTTSAKLLPRMGVSLSWQDMSQPASPEHPEHSCLNRGHCSHIPARRWSALHRWRASPASLAAGARHRWLPTRNIEAVACRPAEAGLGISTDGSARVDPQEQAAGQRARIARGPCRTQKPHPLVSYCPTPSTLPRPCPRSLSEAGTL